MILAITGHRPPSVGGYKVPNPTYSAIRQKLREMLQALKPQFVVSGMALGVDQWAAELCIELGILWGAAIPHDDQEAIWPDASKAKYRMLLAKAHEKVVVSPGPYASWKLHARNKYMVDMSHQVLAVWNGQEGGTANCIAYAQSVNRPIHYIHVVPPESYPYPGQGPTQAIPTKSPFEDFFKEIAQKEAAAKQAALEAQQAAAKKAQAEKQKAAASQMSQNMQYARVLDLED